MLHSIVSVSRGYDLRLFSLVFFFFFFNDTATTEIYTLSLHDALPILPDILHMFTAGYRFNTGLPPEPHHALLEDRKSTRLNSSHRCISYAVFCLKKKKKRHQPTTTRSVPTQHT